MGYGDQVEIENVKVKGKTKKGIWVEMKAYEEKDVFIPYSQIGDDSVVYKVGDTGTMLVSEWLAEKRDWT